MNVRTGREASDEPVNPEKQPMQQSKTIHHSKIRSLLTCAALAALGALCPQLHAATIIQGAGGAAIAFEAEGNPTIIAGTPTTWVTTNDAPASAGAALYIDGTTATGTAPQGFAQYQIKFAAAGTYAVYYRWKADPARTVADQFTANSFFVGGTFGSFLTPGTEGQVNFFRTSSNDINAPANGVYDWRTEATTYTVTAAEVAAGVPLILTIGTREAGFTLDRWVFSTDAALTDAALDALPNSGAKVAAPEIARAVSSAALNSLTVTFTRPLAAASVQASRFTVSGGVNVLTATADAADARRVLLTTSAQTAGTAYTLTVTGVTDTSGTSIAVGKNTAAFTAWKIVDGWTTVEIYQNITGATVADLTGSAAYQARTPDEIRWVKGFQINNDPRAANAGLRLSAFFSPAASGAYSFFTSNDDEAELHLSPNQSEAGLASLGISPLTAAFDDNAPLAGGALTANQKYLLVGLVQSGGGDIYLNVAAKLTSASTPAASLTALGGARISTFVNPDIGNVTFTQSPADASASVGSRARFAVKVTTTENPVYYQWRVNGADIPGATRPVFHTPVLSESDNGKVYSVVVSVAGKDTPSGNATLTVTPGDPSPLQPYLGLNFVGGGDSLPGPLTAVDVAGVVLQDNWNNLAGAMFDQAPLRDAAGSAIPVTFTAAASEHWYCGTLGVGDANGVLLQGYISTGASLDPFLMTLNNVPAGTYNLIVYSIGFPFQASYEEAFSVTGGGTYPTYHVKAETGLEFNTTPVFRRMSSTSAASPAVGNYVQFDNVSPASDGSLTLSATWESLNIGNGHQPAINGIQLVKVVPVTVRPTVAGAKTSTGATITWTASATGFVLESSPVVGAGAAWTAVAGAPNPITGAGSANLVTGGTAAFYRLRK